MQIKKWSYEINCPCGVTLTVEEEDISYQFDDVRQNWRSHWFFVICPACESNMKLFINDFIIPPAIKDRIKKRVSI